MVQWLRLYTPNAGAQVQSLVRELRSRRPHGVDKQKERKQNVMRVWECHKSKPRWGLVSTSKRRLRIEAQICFLP